MQILYMGNNWVGWQVLQWLVEQGETIVGLVLHPSEKQKYGLEMLATANLPTNQVFDAGDLRSPATLEAIERLNADIALSVYFGYILKPEFLHLFSNGVINLHPSFLPYNRGAYPNVWSIIDGTPAGVTLHYIDEQIDTGDIIAQERVPVSLADTGETLYYKLEASALRLFRSTWSQIKAGQAARSPQPPNGTTHRIRDVEKIDRIDLDQKYTARDLLNILRARTFRHYPGAYFVDEEGRRVYVRVELEYEKNDED